MKTDSPVLALRHVLMVLFSALLLACGGGGSGDLGVNNNGNTPGGGSGSSPGGGGSAPPSNLQYPAVTLYQHSVAQMPTPTLAGGAPTSFSIAPSDALPAGLSFGSDGRITGTPLVTATTQVFVVTASNGAGQTTASLSLSVQAPGKKILMFVAYNQVWWAEYKVMYEALKASGYDVEVCSSEASGFATSYQTDGNIDDSANSIGGGSDYNEFIAQFNNQFGLGAWQDSWKTPQNIPITCAIQSIPSMAPYVALVIPGGLGAKAYYLDGSYAESSDGEGHTGSAANVQAAAEKLNALTIEALQSSKPVLAQCHGAPLLAWMRAPGTQGQGPGLLGLSLLKDRSATGFHLPPSGEEASTADMYNTLGVAYRPDRTVVIDGPAPAQLGGSKAGVSKLITTRDWYPQTVMHGAVTLINVLKSHPRHGQISAQRKVLILHGGAVNSGACSPTIDVLTNDVPCNWGANMPADFTVLQSLLASQNSALDPYQMSVSELNLKSMQLPFSKDDANDVANYLLNNFDVVVYFKHWSSSDGSVTPQLQQGLLTFADAGGGLVALHHGLYNDGGLNLLAAAFEAQSTPGDFASTDPYGVAQPKFLNINYGQFVTSFATAFDPTPLANPGFLTQLPNHSASGYPAVTISDELYLNMSFTGVPQFGSGPNQINLLLGNDRGSHSAQMLTAGFSKLYNPGGGESIGRLVYLQPGENPGNYGVNSTYGQMIRNAVIWASMGQK